MTTVAELRKHPRPADNATAQPPSIRQFPSTHISPFVLKVLGLNPGEPRPKEL